jgi:Secretion system C-terminal sorting domain
MLTRFKLISILVPILLLTFSSAHSTIQMYLDKSFTIPGTNPITQLQFADWDRDGIPEVAALSSDSVVVYSITGDSIIFSYRNESIQANPVSILFADVTRDSIPDLVLQYVTNVVLNGDSVDHIYDLLDGAFGLIQTHRAVHKGWGQSGASKLCAIDINFDSYNEVGQSYSSSYSHGCDTYPSNCTWGGESGFTFSDSFSASAGTGGGSASPPLFNPSFQDCIVFYFYQHRGSNLTSEYDSTVWNSTIGLKQKAGPIEFPVIPSTLNPWNYFYFGTDQVVDVLCFGRLSSSESSVSFLVSRARHDHGVVAMLYHRYFDSTDVSVFRLTPADSLELVWSIPTFPSGYTNFVADPDGNPWFYAFFGNQLVKFSGDHGSEIERTAAPGFNSRYWEYMYRDNHLRLVTIDGRKVELWGFDEATSADEPPSLALPTRFELSNPYPNPFNPSVSISFAVPTKGHVRVEVFNLTGQRVVTLLDEVVSAGTKTIAWDASRHASGVYFFRTTFEGQTKTVKAILLK